MPQRFDSARLVLGSAGRRSAALCRFAGYPSAAQSETTLTLMDQALDFAEHLEGVEDIRELQRLTRAVDTWGYAPDPNVQRPQLGRAGEAVAGHLQHLLEQLDPEQLREVGVALSAGQDPVGVALGVVEEAAGAGPDFESASLADFEAEFWQNDARIRNAVDALVLEAPAAWPPMLRAALTLNLVWDVADLVACMAELSAVDTLPTLLLWQATGPDHLCASARVPVPGTDRLVWVTIEPWPLDGRPVWGQSASLEQWGWSLYWQHADGSRAHFKSGHGGSKHEARWRAEWATQTLLADPHRAKSPTTQEPLIAPGPNGAAEQPDNPQE